MEDERERDKHDPGSQPDRAGAAAEEATGQIPAGRARSRSAEKAKEETGQGPTRGVGKKKGD